MNYRTSFALSLIATFVTCATAMAQEKTIPTNELTKQNTSIKAVMQGAHKKPNEILKKTALGKSSKEEQKRLLALYKIMATHKPPKGDIKAWKKRANLLVEATEAVIAGKPDSRKMLSKASNCKDCHTAHKN